MEPQNLNLYDLRGARRRVSITGRLEVLARHIGYDIEGHSLCGVQNSLADLENE